MIEQTVKIFRDNVHGYIDIPVDYVTSFIDTEIFQRLRGIEQTGMRTLYPSARHDRFIHSLGTYFLGHKAFFYFKKNVKANYGGNVLGNGNHFCFRNDPQENEKFWEKHRILFEIACLLHDCGHAPFSHTLEFHYDKELIGGAVNLKEKLKEFNGSTDFKDDFLGQGSPHERMSALLVCSDYKSVIDNLINKYNLDKVDECSNVEFITRAIIGCKYNNTTIHENQIKNCLIELLNSKSIDVDSLDYIIRDSQLSGIDNMNIDVERLLGSLTVVEITTCNNSRIRDYDINANVIEGKLVAPNSSESLNFNGKIRGSFIVRKQITGEMSGMVDLEGYFQPENKVFINADNRPAVILVNGAKIEDNLQKYTAPSSIILYGNIDSNLKFNGHELNFNENTNGKFNFCSQEIQFKSSFINAKISGTLTGELLGNHSNIQSSKVECRLGFHKSSLSVIQNVVIARNYEYQWVYSHHKVVYYSNYLIIDLLKNCVEYLLNDCKTTTEKKSADNELAHMFSWNCMICDHDNDEKYHTHVLACDEIFRPTDADIMALFKKCYLKCIKNKDYESTVYNLLNEYYSRKYKQSLWKSFAEFNIFFSDFTLNERNRIFDLIVKNSSYKLFYQYGYLSDEWTKEFSQFGLDNVVWVSGDSKLKYLNPDMTFILFKDGALTYRSISSTNDIKPVSKLDFFYLFYENSSEKINKAAFMDFIKRKLSENSI